MEEYKLPFLAKLTFALVSIISLGFLLHLGQVVLAPLFLAFLMAALFTPIADFLEAKLRFPRIVSSLCALLLMVVLLSGLGYFFGTQLADFRNDIPHLMQQSSNLFSDLQLWVKDTFHINIEHQFDYINRGIEKLMASSGGILSFTVGIFSSTLMFFFLSILFSVFILNYRKVLYGFIIDVFPKKHKTKVEEIAHEIQSMTKSYLIGICFQIIIVSSLTAIMLSILGVKYAILLGVLTGLLNVIPYIGIGISLVISCFIAFATTTPITCFYVILAYGGIHSIDGNITIPFIVGSRVKINALFSFIGILVGGMLWGVAGMFLCIPAIAIMRIVFERVESLHAWGGLLGEEKKKRKGKRVVRISRKLTIKEKD